MSVVRTRMIHIHSLVIRYVDDAVVRAASEHVNDIVVLLLNIYNIDEDQDATSNMANITMRCTKQRRIVKSNDENDATDTMYE